MEVRKEEETTFRAHGTQGRGRKEASSGVMPAFHFLLYFSGVEKMKAMFRQAVEDVEDLVVISRKYNENVWDSEGAGVWVRSGGRQSCWVSGQMMMAHLNVLDLGQEPDK